jgi:hypothetical protein
MSPLLRHRPGLRLSGALLTCRLAALSLLLASCHDDAGMTEPISTESVRTYTTAELVQRMHESTKLPSDALQLTPEGVLRLYGATERDAGSSITPELAPTGLGESDIFAAIEGVVARNPDFANLTTSELARIAEDLGGLSEAEVLANLHRIRDLYISKIRYEVYLESVSSNRMVTTTGAHFSLIGQWNELNNQEKALLVQFPHLGLGTRRAKVDATLHADSYWGHLGDGHRGNAYKHALWNALIPKHTGHWFVTMDAALSWAKKFTDAHEYGSKRPWDMRHTSPSARNPSETPPTRAPRR